MKLLNLVIIAVAVCLGTLPGISVAEDGIVTDTRGFVYEVPGDGDTRLLAHVNSLHARLNTRRQLLNTRIADTQITAVSAIAAVVLPGGLIYAGYQQVRGHQHRVALKKVEQMLSNLSHDVMHVRARNGLMIVASRADF